MLDLLAMWALVEAIGIIFLPLTTTVFHNIPDRGWAWSKALGIAILAFCIWLPLMVLHFLTFTRIFVLGVLLLLLILNAISLPRTYRPILQILKSNPLYIAVTECVFLGMVFVLGLVRSYTPDIRSFEMYMDEGFLASILRSAHFPPHDMWYEGASINYYYYMHYIVAMLARLLAQPASIAFNTGISMLFGLTAVSLFGLSTNLITWAKRLRKQVDPMNSVNSVRAALVPAQTVEPTLVPAQAIETALVPAPPTESTESTGSLGVGIPFGFTIPFSVTPSGRRLVTSLVVTAAASGAEVNERAVP